jgi:hypothetical protein
MECQTQRLQDQVAELQERLAAAMLLLRPWSEDSGECWQCHAARRGMAHTNGPCRCKDKWKHEGWKARAALGDSR